MFTIYRLTSGLFGDVIDLYDEPNGLGVVPTGGGVNSCGAQEISNAFL